jgi:hypothetical protein
MFTHAEFVWRPDWEGQQNETDFDISLMYGPSWSWAAGLTFTNESVGAGFLVNF